VDGKQKFSAFQRFVQGPCTNQNVLPKAVWSMHRMFLKAYDQFVPMPGPVEVQRACVASHQ
jgi:hypothetical protein